MFQVSKGLGNKYKEFQIVVLSKPPYLSFNQFIMFSQNFEHVYFVEEKPSHDHNQSFLGQRGRGRNMHGIRGRRHGQGPNFSRPLFNNGNNKISNPRFHSKFNNDSKGKIKQHNYGKETYQIFGRTNHTAMTCSYKHDYTIEENT